MKGEKAHYLGDQLSTQTKKRILNIGKVKTIKKDRVLRRKNKKLKLINKSKDKELRTHRD
jgi:hypothetical protein